MSKEQNNIRNNSLNEVYLTSYFDTRLGEQLKKISEENSYFYGFEGFEKIKDLSQNVIDISKNITDINSLSDATEFQSQQITMEHDLLINIRIET